MVGQGSLQCCLQEKNVTCESQIVGQGSLQCRLQLEKNLKGVWI